MSNSVLDFPSFVVCHGLLRGPLDRCVDGQQDDEQDQPVEHAQDRGPAVLCIFLGT
jgi:hypothetical protein